MQGRVVRQALRRLHAQAIRHGHAEFIVHAIVERGRPSGGAKPGLRQAGAKGQADTRTKRRKRVDDGQRHGGVAVSMAGDIYDYMWPGHEHPEGDVKIS